MALTKTISELESIVRFRGDFRNSQRFPSANVQTEIQAAFSEFYELVANANQGWWDTADTVTTTAGVGFVATPTGTWIVRGIDRFDGTEPFALVQVGVAERNRFGTQTGQPRAFRLTARGIDLYPTPDAVYTLRVTYTPVAPLLDSTPRSYVNGWEEYVIYATLVRMALNERRDAGEWQQQLQMQAARVLSSASQRRQSGPEYIPLYDGADGDDDLFPRPTWSW